jgi:hypothetical protein
MGDIPAVGLFEHMTLDPRCETSQWVVDIHQIYLLAPGEKFRRWVKSPFTMRGTTPTRRELAEAVVAAFRYPSSLLIAAEARYRKVYLLGRRGDRAMESAGVLRGIKETRAKTSAGPEMQQSG